MISIQLSGCIFVRNEHTFMKHRYTPISIVFIRLDNFETIFQTFLIPLHPVRQPGLYPAGEEVLHGGQRQ